MIRPYLILQLVLLVAAFPGRAAGLPDTGQTTCYNDSGADGVAASSAASIARDAGTHPRQDCRYGLDAAADAGALTKTGAGAKGFDYSKIANNGTTLPASTPLGTANTAWGCTRDNITGLTWEVKTTDNTDLGYSGHTYTWFSSDSSSNGANSGNESGGSCNQTLPGNLCNTQAFVTAVNAAALCTYTDWRVPTRRELLTLVFADRSIPSIDSVYFPNPSATPYWTASTYAPDRSNAWYIDFADGYTNSNDKTAPNALRVVRGNLF